MAGAPRAGPLSLLSPEPPRELVSISEQQFLDNVGQMHLWDLLRVQLFSVLGLWGQTSPRARGAEGVNVLWEGGWSPAGVSAPLSCVVREGPLWRGVR